MADVKYNCSSCRNEITMQVGQHVIFHDALSWSGSYTCQYCGDQVEMDGGDDIPEEYRDLIIAQEGLWVLSIQEQAAKLSFVLKVLRQTILLTIEDLLKRKFVLPGEIATGTRAEMERLKIRMMDNDIQCSVTRR